MLVASFIFPSFQSSHVAVAPQIAFLSHYFPDGFPILFYFILFYYILFYFKETEAVESLEEARIGEIANEKR